MGVLAISGSKTSLRSGKTTVRVRVAWVEARVLSSAWVASSVSMPPMFTPDTQTLGNTLSLFFRLKPQIKTPRNTMSATAATAIPAINQIFLARFSLVRIRIPPDTMK